MKKWQKLIATALVALLAAGWFAGCSSLPPAEVYLTFQFQMSMGGEALMSEIVDDFNETNEQGIYVDASPSTNLDGVGALLAGSNPPDVVYLDDEYFKGFVQEGYLECLDDYVANSENMDLNDFWDSAVARFRYNADTGVGGGDSPLYALPFACNPTVIYYNKTLFQNKKVNIISVDEDQLEAYNKENGTNYLPHGFYEYDVAPANSLMVNGQGKYYVFNNRIPMNWEELVQCSEIFVEYDSRLGQKYGFINEWWFSYGWSVGGDCLEWISDPNGDGDTSDGRYIFGLNDEHPNYLVTGSAGAVVNGTTYAEGSLLSYDDKLYVADHTSDATIADYLSRQILYPLPSTRDAFVEFCRLSQTTSQEVYNGLNGYGISPGPTTYNNYGKDTYFTSGRVAMMCESLSSTYLYGLTMQEDSWDVAPLYQWREYEADGSYKVVNGTKIMGKQAAHSTASGYAIAAHASEKKKDAAWALMEYMTSEEVQIKLMSAYLGTPCLKSVSMDEFQTFETKHLADNRTVITDAVEYGTVGDWSYVEDSEWISPWAQVLNTNVRNGTMSLAEFFNDPCIKQTNEILKKYKSVKFNG